MMDYYERSLALHRRHQGKIEVALKMPVETLGALSEVYSPGVARPCQEIYANPSASLDLTMKANAVAVVTDGSAVLGLGNIGPLAALPVMEGKALIFKKFANIDAWPICLDTQDIDQIVQTIRHIAPSFGGVNLEDIAAPRCFEIEMRLQDLGIPVFHDDQHGTAMVVLAGLINACRYLRRDMGSLKCVISGAGAAGTAIAELLMGRKFAHEDFPALQDIIVCDSKGAICRARQDLSPDKKRFLDYTNKGQASGSLQEVLKGADVFIGVSKGNLLTAADIRSMNAGPIIFALANPHPEIMPQEAYKGGAAIVATGRSDLPNQVNNALVFPGIFRGALDAKAPRITEKMKVKAALALAHLVQDVQVEHILPGVFDDRVVAAVAKAVKEAACD